MGNFTLFCIISGFIIASTRMYLENRRYNDFSMMHKYVFKKSKKNKGEKKNAK